MLNDTKLEVGEQYFGMSCTMVFRSGAASAGFVS